MNTKKWQARLVKYNSVDRIAVYFDYSKELISRIRKIEGAQWSQQNKVWHLPDTEENRRRFKIAPGSNCQPSEEGIAEIEKFKHWLRSKRYSERRTSEWKFRAPS